MMIKPKTIQIDTTDGDSLSVIISRFPATEGREIITQYGISAVPKLGQYRENEAMLFKMLSYCAVVGSDGQPIKLVTRDLVNNHIPDWETLAKLEIEMLGYNCSFFRDGRASTLLAELTSKVQQSVIKTLTGLLARSSTADKRPSEN